MSAHPSLTLCMIVKDEAAHLPRCLGSVRGLVDEIVIVDTGSTDETRTIAQSAGARLFETVWEDDFSLARNLGLAQATGEWILVLDADESIAARDHQAVRAFLRRTDLDVVVAAQRHYVVSTPVGWQPGDGGYEEGAPYSGFFDVECRRLFRNRPWLRFSKRVHEELVSTDPSRPLVQERGAWVIHHFGKVGDPGRLRAKGEAYLRIGTGKVDDCPDDPLAHYELGVQYSELGRHEDALACFERVQALAPGFRDVVLQAAICETHLQRYQQALETLRTAARTLPQYAGEIALQEGVVYRARGDLASAERACRRALRRNASFAAAHVSLATLLELQGDRSAALAAADRGLERCPRHAELRLVRARLRSAAGDDEGALRDLEAADPPQATLMPRARILARMGRFEEASSCLHNVQPSTMTDPQRSEWAALQGAVALGTGRLDEAVRELRRSLELSPTYEAARNLSTALEGLDDTTGARLASADALRLSPDDEAARRRFRALCGEMLSGPIPREDVRGLTLFFYQPRSLPYDGRTPYERGLGGTESAVVYLADALARRGHRVTVFNNCDAPGSIDLVEYARWESLPVRCLSDRPDVVVAVRSWELIGGVRLAPVQIFWTADAADQSFVGRLGDRLARRDIDLFMLHSRWQIGTFGSQHHVPAWQVVATRLGSAASAAGCSKRPSLGPSRPRRLAYASTPFRGLDVLLHLFPDIRAACPDAELDVFSSMAVYGMSETDDRRAYGEIYARARQPGVNLVGSLPQPELAARLQQARILAYPCHFAETFCIAAVEAQASGCPIVTSDLGALRETVGDAGVCVAGDPHTAAYQREFVDACIGLLIDDERWRALHARALERAWGPYTWGAIAEHWEQVCTAALTREPGCVERVAVHLAAGRPGLAQRILDREAPPAHVPSRAWDALKTVVGWRAGHGDPPDVEVARQVALHFRSFRAARLFDLPAGRPGSDAGAAA